MADGALPKLLARRRDAGRKTLRTRDRRRAVRVTVSNASYCERAGVAPGRYSISRRNLAADALQVQRRAISDSIYGWRKPRSGTRSKQSGGSQAALVILLVYAFGGNGGILRRAPLQLSAAARAACQCTAVTNGSRLIRPMICSRAPSLRSAETSRALTVTCGESSRFSLVSRRKPRRAAEAA